MELDVVLLRLNILVRCLQNSSWIILLLLYLFEYLQKKYFEMKEAPKNIYLARLMKTINTMKILQSRLHY